MSSVTVRFWSERDTWVCDVSEKVAGRAFGKGPQGRAAAEAFAEDARRKVGAGTFQIAQTMTFADLWYDFCRFHLPTIKPSTAADYVALGKNYLVPFLGERLLAELRVRVIEEFKEWLLNSPGFKASGKEGSKKPLSARPVAKLIILLGTVFRFAQRQELMANNPASSVHKPRARKRAVYMLDPSEIARLRAALDIPWQRLLVELTITTGIRSGEIRGLAWESVDLQGSRLFIEQQVTLRGEQSTTKTENSVRVVPIPQYLVPLLKRWKLECPPTTLHLVFPGEPNGRGERAPIDADHLLRNILRRALRRAGLPAIRFHDMRHLAGSLMHEAGVPLKRAQEILGHASERTTLEIYTHSMRRQHDDTADRIAELAGLTDLGNIWETNGDTKAEETPLSRCSNGSPGRIRTADQRINSPSLYH